MERNPGGELFHKHGAAWKDLVPSVKSIFSLGGSSNKVLLDLRSA